jgi:OOP family OmpA-OmpF porin
MKKLQLASVHLVDQQVDIAGKSLTSQDIENLQQALAPFREQNYKINIRIAALDNAAVVCQKEFNRLLTEDNILFKTGNAMIDSRSDQLLTELADAAIFCAHATIIITGYTDNVGDEEKNKQLSEQRAKAVKGRLFNQGGVPLERLKTVGKGASDPLADNDTDAGRAQNRRIEFKVEGI